jgi:hypothetical protein
VLIQSFCRSLPAECLAWPAVERGRDGFDLFGVPPGQVGALGSG